MPFGYRALKWYPYSDLNRETPGFKPGPYANSGIGVENLAPAAGLEPTTIRLTGERTTIVLYENLKMAMGIEPTPTWLTAKTNANLVTPSF